MIKVISFNLRLDVPSDGANNFWQRKHAIYQFLKDNKADLIGLQEVLPSMYEDIQKQFDQYHMIGIPRDAYGEATPILVHKQTFEILSYDTKWLSDTPDILSIFDDSAFPRIVTYVKLKHKLTQKTILFLNTHLDYMFGDVIFAQTKVLKKIIKEQQKDLSTPIIFTGDFNQTPSSKTISYLGKTYRHVLSSLKPMPLTFHGFNHPKAESTIDYIFYSAHLDLLEVIVDQEKMLSDHYPVIATLQIKD